MNSNDIYRKSSLGREEIKNQSIGVLPREARTLLIMIDGKKTYQNYFDSLDKSKMFFEFGGVAPLFELLLDFQCIELIDPDTSANKSSASSQIPATLLASQNIQPPTQSNDPEFDEAFNNQGFNEINRVDTSSKAITPDISYESLRSELATYIEDNAPPEEAWGYLLRLEQCEGAVQLLALAQDIQNANNAHLSRGMDEFSKKIKRQL
ncbi:hypothetical protein [Psychrobacter jeotgali]|uniref:hypothetical protein n=1 Tax=Psychrobacter jeotgali TaxID=179010 RepID=UPI00191ACCF1|nr:hypothetical protein [Psychrobacter jeotgali]